MKKGTNKMNIIEGYIDYKGDFQSSIINLDQEAYNRKKEKEQENKDFLLTAYDEQKEIKENC